MSEVNSAVLSRVACDSACCQEDLCEMKVNKVVKPRPAAATSIPGMLRHPHKCLTFCSQFMFPDIEDSFAERMGCPHVRDIRAEDDGNSVQKHEESQPSNSPDCRLLAWTGILTPRASNFPTHCISMTPPAVLSLDFYASAMQRGRRLATWCHSV